MRTETASAAIVRARVTHQIVPGVAARGGDALAIVEDGPLPAGSRIFVPGRLPCGECAACRRALCDGCVAARAIARESDGRVSVPDRFIATVDPALPALGAIAAGLLADVIGAGGRAGLGAGDSAVWLGEPAWTRVGAAWSVSRGARTFVLAATAPASSPEAASAPVPLALTAGPAAWRETIAEAEAAGGPAGGRPERRIFVCGAGPDLARAALELVTPGSTLSFLRGAPPALAGLDAAPPLRLFTGGAGHPDLIPEALAAMSRGEVASDELFAEVSAGDGPAALADFRRGLDRPIPVVAFQG
jgi:hypothetical protein